MFCLGQSGEFVLRFEVRVWSGTRELSGLLVCLLFIPFIPKHCQEKKSHAPIPFCSFLFDAVQLKICKFSVATEKPRD